MRIENFYAVYLPISCKDPASVRGRGHHEISLLNSVNEMTEICELMERRTLIALTTQDSITDSELPMGERLINEQAACALHSKQEVASRHNAHFVI